MLIFVCSVALNFLEAASVCTVWEWWDRNGLSGSDLDAWILSIALLNLMVMLLSGFRSFWSVSMSFLSILVVLSSACSMLYNK